MPIADRGTDSFRRLFCILQLLPRAPRWLDTATLADLLLANGFINVRRTLQRDLVKLERMGFGLQSAHGTKPYRWRLADGVVLPVVPSRFDQLRTPRAVDLKIRVEEPALEHVRADPLSPRQRVIGFEHSAQPGGPGAAILEARVVLDSRLRARILALGAHVEVMEPEVLRDEVAFTHRLAWERYARTRKPALVGGV